MLESATGYLAPATNRWRLLQRSGRLAGAALCSAILLACAAAAVAVAALLAAVVTLAEVVLADSRRWSYCPVSRSRR